MKIQKDVKTHLLDMVFVVCGDNLNNQLSL